MAYYTMPFVKGESLRAQLARGANLSMHDRLNVLRDVARALAYAHGEGDDHDNSLIDVPFHWNASRSVRSLRVGYLRDAVGEGTASALLTPVERATLQNNAEALRVMRELGVKVEPMELPRVRVEAIDFIRYAETAAAFDDITRNDRLREIETGPEQSRRPAEIRAARFIPAVEYAQANRYRTRVMQQRHDAMQNIDVVLGANIAITNRTGHPVVSIPSGFVDGSPTGLSMTGKLFGDAELLMLARAFQQRIRIIHNDHRFRDCAADAPCVKPIVVLVAPLR